MRLTVGEFPLDAGVVVVDTSHGVLLGLTVIAHAVLKLAALHVHRDPAGEELYTSGMVVMMSLLGGMGTFFGPFVGAAVFLLLENLVSLLTVHWQLVVGAVFVVCVLFFPAGIWGSILKRVKS